MTLPTENPTAFSVGRTDEDGDVGRGIAVLDSLLFQDMRWCPNCGGEQIFVPVYEFAGGRVGFCFGCGDERIAGFTRVTTEVA
jgi:hypothetical protein